MYSLFVSIVCTVSIIYSYISMSSRYEYVLSMSILKHIIGTYLHHRYILHITHAWRRYRFLHANIWYLHRMARYHTYIGWEYHRDKRYRCERWNQESSIPVSRVHRYVDTYHKDFLSRPGGSLFKCWSRSFDVVPKGSFCSLTHALW